MSDDALSIPCVVELRSRWLVERLWAVASVTVVGVMLARWPLDAYAIVVPVLLAAVLALRSPHVVRPRLVLGADAVRFADVRLPRAGAKIEVGPWMGQAGRIGSVIRIAHGRRVLRIGVRGVSIGTDDATDDVDVVASAPDFARALTRLAPTLVAHEHASYRERGASAAVQRVWTSPTARFGLATLLAGQLVVAFVNGSIPYGPSWIRDVWLTALVPFGAAIDLALRSRRTKQQSLRVSQSMLAWDSDGKTLWRVKIANLAARRVESDKGQPLIEVTPELGGRFRIGCASPAGIVVSPADCTLSRDDFAWLTDQLGLGPRLLPPTRVAIPEEAEEHAETDEATRRRTARD